MTRKGTQPALLQLPGPNIIQEISILYVARLENCQILLEQNVSYSLFLNQKAQEEVAPHQIRTSHSALPSTALQMSN